MKSWQAWGWLSVGLLVGVLGTRYFQMEPKIALAHNDRADDCIMCTGTMVVGPNAPPNDAIWMLDYRAGRLLGSIVDRSLGRVLPFQQVDLVKEFDIAPKQNVHFMMTTGVPISGQTALYVAETVTGKFAIYTMGANQDPRLGAVIRRHHATTFRP